MHRDLEQTDTIQRTRPSTGPLMIQLQRPSNYHVTRTPRLPSIVITVRPVEVGRVVGSGKETDVLRDRRDDAAANLKRGRAEGGREHDGAERRPVGGPEIAPQVGLQVGPEGGLADDVGAQQAGADPAD